MKRQKNGIWKLSDEEMLDLAIYAWEAETNLTRRGQHLIADQARSKANAIHDILEKAGYFDGQDGG